MIFISYSRRDTAVVARLSQDLQRLNPWFDRELVGAEEWWSSILAKIRSCDLFIFLMSRSSLDSAACKAELAYAVATHRRVLPISIDEVPTQTAPAAINAMNVKELSLDGRDNLTEVQSTMLALPERDLPSPMPDEPEMPITDLSSIREVLSAPTLTLEQQQTLIGELRHHACNVDLEPAVLELARKFQGRHDLYAQIKDELHEIAKIVREGAIPEPERILRADLIEKIKAQWSDPQRSTVTPILGSGLTDTLLGTRPEAARWLADRGKYPFSSYRRNDLAVVAQFVRVMRGRVNLIGYLETYIRERLSGVIGPERAHTGTVAEALDEAWRSHARGSVTDVHSVLANMPCPVYLNAHPWGLLKSALIAAGKDPVIEVCRWKQDQRRWPESVYATDPDYQPTVERPLVYHLFGLLDYPETLVLTEDDHLDFVMGVTGNEKALIAPVRSALADSALLLLGFNLEHLDIRVLLTLVHSQPGADLLNNYDHVAAQLNPPSGEAERKRIQAFLQKYVGGTSSPPAIDIYWGSLEEFSSDLAIASGLVTS